MGYKSCGDPGLLKSLSSLSDAQAPSSGKLPPPPARRHTGKTQSWLSEWPEETTGASCHHPASHCGPAGGEDELS